MVGIYAHPSGANHIADSDRENRRYLPVGEEKPQGRVRRVDRADRISAHAHGLPAAYMPGCRLGSLSASPKLIPEDGSAPGFDIVQSHFDTSAAVRLRSPLSIVPVEILFRLFRNVHHHRFLTIAACGGLRSTPDCRPRRTFLHLPYSCATPLWPSTLGPLRHKLLLRSASGTRYAGRLRIPALH